MLFGIHGECLIFGAMLLGIAIFHRHALTFALLGLLALVAFELASGGLRAGPELAGLAGHFASEWVVLVNLFALLLGFALLARHFELSAIPAVLPRILPDDWKGGFVLLL